MPVYGPENSTLRCIAIPMGTPSNLAGWNFQFLTASRTLCATSGLERPSKDACATLPSGLIRSSTMTACGLGVLCGGCGLGVYIAVGRFMPVAICAMAGFPAVAPTREQLLAEDDGKCSALLCSASPIHPRNARSGSCRRATRKSAISNTCGVSGRVTETLATSILSCGRITPCGPNTNLEVRFRTSPTIPAIEEKPGASTMVRKASVWLWPKRPSNTSGRSQSN